MLFNYTTELRTYFENLPINEDQSLPHAAVIENGRPILFNFDYPLFDASYKKIFETHFIRKFYMRQIGFETFGLFQFQLETWLIINMPYFNKLFESELLQFDPLTNTKYDEAYNKRDNKTQADNRTITGSKELESEENAITNKTGSNNRIGSTNTEQTGITKGNTESTQESNIIGDSESKQNRDETGSITDNNFNRQLESDTPDGRLGITAADGVGVIEYASNIKENKENNSKSTNISGSNSNTETSKVDSANKSSDSTQVNNETQGSTSITDNTEITDNTIDNATTNLTQNDSKNDDFNSNISSIEDYVSNRYGKIGTQTFSKMVQEYRSSFLRIENQIFEEMNELFMLVY